MSVPNRSRELINGVVSSLASRWQEHDHETPDRLYHYTSADGLIGILGSQSIWMTDLRYMNDMSELQYARDLIAQRVANQPEKELSAAQREFLHKISGNFIPIGTELAVFSAFFCEEGNLLSQWRAYRGAGGGYAIGFDFFHMLRLLDRPCVLRRVVYDIEQQVKFIDDTIGVFLTTVEAMATGEKEADLPETLSFAHRAFSSVAAEMLFSFKHPDFREEREWRLVTFLQSNPRYDRGAPLPKTRSYEGNIIPYYAVSFAAAIQASKDDTMGIGFPINELMIGPTINVTLNHDSVKTMLLSLNPDVDHQIRHSEIPLRWL
jgi:hypothetical protein